MLIGVDVSYCFTAESHHYVGVFIPTSFVKVVVFALHCFQANPVFCHNLTTFSSHIGEPLVFRHHYATAVLSVYCYRCFFWVLPEARQPPFPPFLSALLLILAPPPAPSKAYEDGVSWASVGLAAQASSF